jgi:hypothetical protein
MMNSRDVFELYRSTIIYHRKLEEFSYHKRWWHGKFLEDTRRQRVENTNINQQNPGLIMNRGGAPKAL